MDILFANLPWLALGIAWLLCLAISALGFRRVDWFISIGYGLSIAAQAVVFSVLHASALTPLVIVQQLLFLAYGLRLSWYLVARERSASFGRELEASKQRSERIVGGVKVAIWISVSALYVTMYSPGVFTLTQAASGGIWLPIGAVVMLTGLVLESAADAQKSRLKALNPTRFVSVGLYAIVRSPNYFGEMVFWFGAFISGIAAYTSLAAWLIALVGLVCIELIMLGSARRLELKQVERYGTDAAYQAYAARVPVLLPLVPLYSLRRLRVYLG